jgi:(E)-4-hydroxy-3-methylbut-2-enyl-diphosphate synthase
MTKVPTTDADRCVRQINQLVQAGCALVRVAVPRRADTAAFAQLVSQVRVPLIADIHFSPARAIEAIEAGAAKIRLNPGNIKNPDDILRIIDAAKAHRIAIRIGVNEASIRDLSREPVPPRERIDLMLTEMGQYVRLFEGRGFDQLVLSAKTSDVMRTIEVNRRIAEAFAYPMHLGLTHAGLPEDARIPSAVRQHRCCRRHRRYDWRRCAGDRCSRHAELGFGCERRGVHRLPHVRAARD